MNYSGQICSSQKLRSTQERHPLNLPRLVRAETIRGSEKGVVERRHTYHLAQEPTNRSLEGQANGPTKSKSLSMRGLQSISVNQCFAGLEQHLTNGFSGGNSRDWVVYFLKALTELESEIVAGGHTVDAIFCALVAMETYERSSTVQRLCLHFLLVLPIETYPPNRTVRCALAAMRNHPKNGQIQSVSCQVIDDLLRHAGERVFRTFNEEGGIEILVAASKAFDLELHGSSRILRRVATLADAFFAQVVSDKSMKPFCERRLDALHARIVSMRLQSDLLV